MATLKGIAEKCGVSIGTVDRVLHNRGRVNAETRQRILAAAEELQYVPNRSAQSLAVCKKKLHLGFVMLEAGAHPFYADINRAAKRKAEELREFGVTVTMLRCEIAIHPNETFTSRIIPPDDVDMSRLDGVVCAGEMDHIPGFPDDLKNKPVAYYNMCPENHSGLIYVGCDYYKAGTVAAGLCALSGGQKPRIAILSEGSQTAAIDSYVSRVRGFQDRLQGYYPECQIVGTKFFSNHPDEDESEIEAFFRDNPDITAVYLVNPGNYDICRMIRKLDPEHKISIITNDLVPQQKELFQEGIISATITQEPEKQGTVPLDALFRYLAFGEKPEEYACFTNLDIRIASNID